MRLNFQRLVLLTAVFGLLVGGAFAGGIYYGRDTSSASSAQTAATPAASPGVNTLGAGGGGAFPGGAPTTGVVESVNGDTLSVRTQAGGTVAIKLQPETQVSQVAAASPADLRPGVTVSVQGQPDTDGKVAARSVQITGTGQPGGGQPGTRPAGARGPATPTPAP